ncbi:GNVR domain-containing protein [Sphingomonas rosea]|uniref:GNVR domain-containing protein n=1 Tax=Sphingomonas rosea TaxID=335605 RepID=UPI0031D6B948
MLSFYDWIDAIRYRWKLVAFATGVLLVLSLLYILVAPRTYTATSSLLLDTGAPDPLSDDKAGGSAPDNRQIVATQADLVRSPHVAGQAALISGVAKEAEYQAKWRKETDEKQPYAAWISDEMRKSLTVEPGRDTNVLLIQAKARNPQDAAKIANGFARASVDSQYKLRTEPAKAYATWLENSLQTARTDVVKKQDELAAFTKATGIVNNGDLTSEGNAMADVSTQLATAEARAAAARQSAFEGAQGRGDAEKSEGIQRLRASVAEKSAQLSQLESVFGPEYPDVKKTRAELGTLQSQLNSQVSQTAGALSSARGAEAAAERAAAAASEARLRNLAAQQRARVAGQSNNLAQFQRLQNEFAAAQKTFNDLNTRLTRMRLQSAVPLTGVQVLDTATAPIVPSSPNVPLTLALATMLGALLGAAGAIWLEYRDPRVRSRGGIERLLGAPVVGRIALPVGQRTIANRDGDGPLLLEGQAA